MTLLTWVSVYMPYHICGCVVNCCTEKEKREIKSVLELEKPSTPFSCMQIIISKQGLISSQNSDQNNFRSYPKMKLNFSSCWTWWQKSLMMEGTRSDYMVMACRLWNFKACPHKHRYFFSLKVSWYSSGGQKLLFCFDLKWCLGRGKRYWQQLLLLWALCLYTP